MTLQHMQQRDPLHAHNRRGKVVARALIPTKPTTTTTTTKAAETKPAATTAKATVIPVKPATTATPVTPVTPATPANPAGVSDTTTTTTSTGTSTTLPATTTTSTPLIPATKPTTTSTTSATSTTPIVPLVTSPSLTSPTAGSQTSIASSASTTPVASSGLGTGAIIGIVAGTLGGIAVMGMIIAFFVRHFRKRRRDRDFDPTEFRRSAIALPGENEKNGGGMRPRPPSMIERKNLVAKSTASAQRNVPAPSMAYPYSDQASAVSVPSAPPSLYGSEHGPQHPHYGAAGARYAAVPQAPPPGTPYGPVPGAYGVPPPLAPYNGAQYEQAGYGAPPIPGTYGPGAYASYGAAGDPRYPQYPHNKPQGYPQFSAYHQQAQVPARYAQQPQQPMYGYAVPQPAAPPAPMQNNSVRSVSASPASPPPSAESVLSSSSTVAASSSGHRRQPTQSSGAPPAYEDDEDSKRYQATRDQKIRPVELGVQNGTDASTGSSSSATTVAPAATAAKPTKTRSNSIHTVYDDGDVYGGM